MAWGQRRARERLRSEMPEIHPGGAIILKNTGYFPGTLGQAEFGFERRVVQGLADEPGPVGHPGGVAQFFAE